MGHGHLEPKTKYAYFIFMNSLWQTEKKQSTLISHRNDRRKTNASAGTFKNVSHCTLGNNERENSSAFVFGNQSFRLALLLNSSFLKIDVGRVWPYNVCGLLTTCIHVGPSNLM